MKNKLFSLCLSSVSYSYKGTAEEDAAAAAKAKAEADAKAAEEAAAKAAKGKLYTEDEFNRHTAAQRRAHEAEAKKTAAELSRLSEDKRLTQEERDGYAKRLEEVEAQYKTQQQLADERVKKAEEKYKKDNETYKKDAEGFKKKYIEMKIDNELTTEAALADEAVPGQLKVFVQKNTVLQDEIGEDGKATGNEVVRIILDDVDGDKKPVKLTLPVKAAFKRMKEKPELFGNLFKGSGTGGVGSTSGKGGGGSGGTMPTDTAAYMAARKKG